MGGISKGTVVFMPFPYSDLSQAKSRPAVVLACAGRNDWLLCQVTSNAFADGEAVRLDDSDFDTGSLRKISFARPSKLFAADARLFETVVGELKPQSYERVRAAVLKFIAAA